MNNSGPLIPGQRTLNTQVCLFVPQVSLPLLLPPAFHLLTIHSLHIAFLVSESVCLLPVRPLLLSLGPPIFAFHLSSPPSLLINVDGVPVQKEGDSK